MALFSSHVDQQLVHLANNGVLPPRQWSRVLRHARDCARCGARYERVMNLRRVFARDTVTEPSGGELEWLATHRLASVLDTVDWESRHGGSGRAPGEARSDTGVRRAHRWWLQRVFSKRVASTEEQARLGAPAREGRGWAHRLLDTLHLSPVGGAWVVALMAAGGLLWLSLPSETTEWGVRGQGQAVAVRLFCVPDKTELREVRGEGTCPAGASLAFAAGARAPYTHVAVTIRTSQGVRVEGPFEVQASPGAETALDLTPRMPVNGEVRLTTTFANSAAAALAAAKGEAVRDAVQFHHRVRVGDSR
ncbi:hypothetical protein [Myxococcus landrumensis]|uniref:Zinc-finger domain-containing protein n=1 Tax=Myxococcus landrumensis TaxID=2813577 RepID=A0ABX7MYX6_9BACT|nr:hypothetical protein [Myxococcus landrumus]QSQ11636.1 hypothetical protein JY572_24950 [Myxococcus landrumus]